MDEFPQPEAADHLHSMVRGALGVIPIVGAPVSELFSIVVTPLLEQRRTEWLNEIGRRLESLEKQQGGILERLQKSEIFVDASINATRIALTTSAPELKNALENALLNTAKGKENDATTIHLFFNWLERFTPLHLKILFFFYSPRDWFTERQIPQPNIGSGSSMVNVFFSAFPEFAQSTDIIYPIWAELKQTGLHSSIDLSQVTYGDDFFSPRLTSLGRKFVEFIR